MKKLETKDLEIELLDTEMKAAYTTIETLQQRVSELEQQILKGNKQCNQVVSPPSSVNCLLLGDTNLQRVLRSDLGATCSVKTITGANMDLLRSWVIEKLHRSPSECVIYCGLYDILRDVTPEKILDNLGLLISDLKEKNSDMKISVCQIVPVPMSQETETKIDDYNRHLEKWGESNGVTVIKTVPSFRLGTGDIDDLCFETAKDNELLVLNRIGIIKLLGSIYTQCTNFQLCSGWDTVKRNSVLSLNVTQNKDTLSTHRIYGQHSPENTANSPPPQTPPTSVLSHPPPATVKHQPPYFAATRSAIQHPPSAVPRYTPPATFSQATVGHPLSQSVPFPGPPTTGQRGATRPPSYAVHQGGSRPRSTETSHWGMFRHGGAQHAHHTSLNVRNDPRDEHMTRTTSFYNVPNTYHGQYSYNPTSHRRGCYNCGEYNHHQNNCRFDHRVKCLYCHKLGHKHRLCRHYNP